MPHFIFGRGKYDNWITHEVIAAGQRQVVDASETCLLVHFRHDYHLVEGTRDLNAVGRSVSDDRDRPQHGQFWSEGKKSKFELFINIYLSLHVGSYTNQKGSVLFAPWKLGRCAEDSGMCLIHRKRPGICPCEYSGYTKLTQTDPIVKNGSRIIRCGLLSQETKESFSIPVSSSSEMEQEPVYFGMPLTMTSVAEKVVINNTLVVTALTFSYRTLLMNWVCNLRELGISNFVIAALDVELYKYGFVRGLPTYYESSVFEKTPILSDAPYGTNSFKQITKAKSKVVLRFMKMGYNVLWSDCDIVFFRNPLHALWSMNADLAIQSNAPDEERANSRRRLNSGFYLATKSSSVVAAFESVIAYAHRSSMSEQPCFYDILCGKSGEFALGNDTCTGKDVLVKVLDRSLFPNGVTRNIWATERGKIKERVISRRLLIFSPALRTRTRWHAHPITAVSSGTRFSIWLLTLTAPNLSLLWLSFPTYTFYITTG
jgi:beta-arabinofuranosyltransferase